MNKLYQGCEIDPACIHKPGYHGHSFFGNTEQLSKRRLRVYVGGPMLGSGNPYVNIHRGLEISMMILDRGMAPYIPHLTAILEMTQGERHRDVWLELDKAFLLSCDAMLRLPGESPGADQEVVWAVAAGIPVFMGLETLFAWQETRR